MNQRTWVAVLLITLGVTAAALAGEKKIRRADLPPAVLKTADELARTATIVGFAKETEGGKTVYEVETKVGGKTRDVTIDGEGKIITVEEEVDLASIPAPARAAIEKAAGDGGKVTLVEKVSHGEQVKFEAQVQPKKGKKTEVSFLADGRPAQ